MSSAFGGQTGTVSIGSSISEVVRWEVTLKADIKDSSSMSSAGWREQSATLRGWEGNFETRVYPSVVPGSIYAATLNTGTGQPTGGASGTAKQIAGSVAVTEMPIAVPHDDLIQWRVSFIGHGSYSLT